GVFGLQVQRRFETGAPANQRLLDLGEQVLAADQEFDRFGELVDQPALRIGEAPGEADDAGLGDLHRVIIAQSGMQIDQPTPLLGGLTPATFMRRHWQKKPLLIRAAVVEAAALVRREELFALAARDDVESRLARRQGERWSLRP